MLPRVGAHFLRKGAASVRNEPSSIFRAGVSLLGKMEMKKTGEEKLLTFRKMMKKGKRNKSRASGSVGMKEKRDASW